MKFLIVDDDPIARKLLRYYLSYHGECHEATDGILAIPAIRSAIRECVPYDVAFIDIVMPDIDGYKVLETIQEFRQNDQMSPHTLKAIVVSANTDWDSIHKIYQKGCDGYLVKPVTYEKIKQILAEIGCLCIHNRL